MAGVQIGFGTPEATTLGEVRPEELEAHTFPEGSMGPKVRAAIDFVRGGGRMAAIGASFGGYVTLAYGGRNPTDETVAVYDLGGGTFDISIIEIRGDTPAIEVPITGDLAPNVYASVGVMSAVVLAIAFIPVPHRVKCTVYVQPRDRVEGGDLLIVFQ